MKLLTFKQLGPEKGIPYSRDHWRRKCNAGEAPRPIPISDRRVAWIESEVDAWLAGRVAERDSTHEMAGAQPEAEDPSFGSPPRTTARAGRARSPRTDPAHAASPATLVAAPSDQ
jgi:prophage regulatory protein